ncbi:MAG: carbonic anhydrase [Gemmatimonadales bacterium]
MRCDWATAMVFSAAAAAPCCAQAQWKTPWDYQGSRGPEHWSALDTAYAACNNGREQSPIDIRAVTKADLPALRFDYTSAPIEGLTDNGKTIRVNYHGPRNDNVLIVGADRYRLTQFHFHRPAEELVNGKRYDMVLHLMHAASDGRIAGVAVFLTAGKANATIQRLWDHMPTVVGKEESIPGVDVDPSGLLPRDAAYYMYAGSLTAPPCTEGVTWFVLETPVEISAAQIAAFAKRYPGDVRPVQPLNGRVVKVRR